MYFNVQQFNLCTFKFLTIQFLNLKKSLKLDFDFNQFKMQINFVFYKNIEFLTSLLVDGACEEERKRMTCDEENGSEFKDSRKNIDSFPCPWGIG